MSVTHRRSFIGAFLLLFMGAMLVLGPMPKAESHGGWYVYPYETTKSGATIYGTGYLQTTYGHANANITVRVQRKVCGFWGCSFENKGNSSYGSMGFSGTFIQRTANAPCVSGTNRYRTHIVYNISEPTYIQTGSTWSPGVERTC